MITDTDNVFANIDEIALVAPAVDADDAAPVVRKKGAKAPEATEEAVDCEGSTVLDMATVSTMTLEAQSGLLLSVLAGTYRVKDGALVLNETRPSGPRGELAHVAARREEARVAIYEAVSKGPFTVNDLVNTSGLTYYDIQYVARREQIAGRLVETKAGRKSTFALPGQEG